MAFAVQESVHLGADGEATARNAPSLDYVAYARYLTWSNLTLPTLEAQALVPLFGDAPVELGAGISAGQSDHYSPLRLRNLVTDDAEYATSFARAFGSSAIRDGVTWDHAIAALSAFQRSLGQFDSAYDDYLDGRPNALSEAQERGRQLFHSERLGCGTCHAGPLLSLAFPTAETPASRAQAFRNTGLYNLDDGDQVYFGGGQTRYPAPNIGIAEFTQALADDGKFRIPSLRNVAVTPPYMHDGSKSTLESVIDHYARGGSLTISGERAGDGRLNPYKDALVSGFSISALEKADLVEFLRALTDRSYDR